MRACVVGLTLLISFLPSLAQPAKQLRAGAALVDISPWMGLSIEGNMHDHKVTSVHDPLHARSLVLDNGETRLAIVVADSCMIPRSVFDEAKRLVNTRAQFPVENILMSATHTHSAPSSVG